MSSDPHVTAPARGRARSHSMHEGTHDELMDDLAALGEGAARGADAGGAPAAAPRRRSSRESGSGAAAAPAAAPAGLSRKTISLLSNLEQASKTVPPELEHTVERVLTEEELEERELAQRERQQRQGGAAAGGGAAEGQAAISTAGGSSHSSGATGPVGGAAGGGSLGTSAAVAGGLGGGGSIGRTSGVSIAPPVVLVAGSSGGGGGGGGGAGAVGARRPGGGAGGPGRPGEQPFDALVKLLLLGDSGVGKTSLLTRYADDKFSPSLLSTAGVDYKTQMLAVDGKTVKCQIWDTAGQQRFHVITQAYYRGAHGIVLVYDASDPTEESFKNVRYWMANIDQHASSGVVKMLLGNKIDVKGKRVSFARVCW